MNEHKGLFSEDMGLFSRASFWKSILMKCPSARSRVRRLKRAERSHARFEDTDFLSEDIGLFSEDVGLFSKVVGLFYRSR